MLLNSFLFQFCSEEEYQKYRLSRLLVKHDINTQYDYLEVLSKTTKLWVMVMYKHEPNEKIVLLETKFVSDLQTYS
jgi:hypothetical protein